MAEPVGSPEAPAWRGQGEAGALEQRLVGLAASWAGPASPGLQIDFLESSVVLFS